VVKIARLEIFHYLLTYKHGEYVMSGGRAATTQDSTVLRLTTDDGVEGWGEVSPLGGTYLPTFPAGIRAALVELAPHLIGADPTNLSRIHQIMDSALLGADAAKCAVDVACWDILGKRADLPIATLLGGVLAEDFPLYEAVPLADPAAMADFVARRSAAGVRQFQLKVGNDPLDDAARTRAVLDRADPDITIIADSNGGWNIPQALAAVRAMAGMPIYIEQPCRRTVDCAIVQASSSLPLVLDESILTLDDLFDAKHVAHAGSVNIKLSRVGGITAAARMRDRAHDLGMTVSIEDTWGGDITTAAVSHVAASTAPTTLLTTSFFNDWTNEHIAASQPRSSGGRGSAPLGAGLGIEVDTELLVPLFSA
jgi:L-alanine-DL-glutamate epimerase-like enolase superfamily enzyme